VTDLRLGIADATTRSDDDTTHRAHALIAEHVGPGANGPVLLAVAGPDDRRTPALTLDRLAGHLDAAPTWTPCCHRPRAPTDRAMLQVVPTPALRTPPPRRWSTTCARRSWRTVLAGTGADALVGGSSPRASTSRRSTPARCPGSSPSCCWRRSRCSR
jgi:hypothetical protein